MVKNLLFDLGGVIADLQRHVCIESFKKLGFNDVDNFLNEYRQLGVFDDLESGRICASEFYDAIRAHIGKDLSDETIGAAFESFIAGIPAKRLADLRELHKRYRLYLISNTNPIMWNGILAREFQREGLTIDDYFDGTITSFDAKCLKPDAPIFHAAEEKFGILPEETIFLDDSAANIEAARALGYIGIHVEKGAEFAELIAKYHQLND